MRPGGPLFKSITACVTGVCIWSAAMPKETGAARHKDAACCSAQCGRDTAHAKVPDCFNKEHETFRQHFDGLVDSMCPAGPSIELYANSLGTHAASVGLAAVGAAFVVALLAAYKRKHSSEEVAYQHLEA